MLIKIIIVLCIILCIVVLAGLVQTRKSELTTKSYIFDLSVDKHGYVSLTVTHEDVKKETFWLKYDHLGNEIREALDNNKPINIICYSSPLFSKDKIKEISYHNKRIV